MKKMLRMLAAALALLLVLSCAAMAEEGSDEMILATVNGLPVPIDAAFAEYHMYAEYYTMYGMSAETIADLREDVADYYIRQHLLYYKADELGLTDALDAQAVQDAADAMYEEVIAAYAEYYAAVGATEEEKRATAIEYMELDGYTPEMAYQDAFNNARLQALLDHTSGEAAVSVEEVRAEYDRILAEQMESYNKYISNFKSAYDKGETIYYTPEGVRFVKHILISLSDADQARMSELDLELSGIDVKLQVEGADVESLTARQAEIKTEIEAIYATVMPTIEEIQAKLEAGEDFLALMDQYGEDSGMKPGSANYQNGYMVWENCVNWVVPFTEGSMALTEIGQVSGPVYTNYGVHLIRYESELPGNTVSFEEAQEELHARLVMEKQSDIFMAELEKWEAEAEIVRYTENLDILRQQALMEAAEAAAAAQ